MSGFDFELHRSTNVVTSREQAHVTFWSGSVSGLGNVELVVPALEVLDARDRGRRSGAMVTGESIPRASFTGLWYGQRPRLAEGRLSVAGQDAAVSRRAWRASRRGRALRVWAVGREYRYRETTGRRHHLLSRPEASVSMARSSWKDPDIISGSAQGSVDSVDISLAILFEGVYTRNLSLRGAVISGPSRLLARVD
ncbi:hypothetical protein ACI2LV_04075 [Streptomyces fungicidicus]|jgi:hypothetical protein|uniref:hypothetical protein n=1 Tax=Streptomyces fungicidicus TaxID=68203 RepID=UPI00384E4DE0